MIKISKLIYIFPTFHQIKTILTYFNRKYEQYCNHNIPSEILKII